MKKIASPSLVFLLLFLSHDSFTAGFDCAQARAGVEKTICASPELSRLDEQLSERYQAALQAGVAVKKQQQAWLRDVRNRCREPDCLLNAYRQRIAELSPAGESGWKLFRDNRLGIEFSYPPQRQLSAACHGSDNCVALVEPGASGYLLAIEVFDGGLEQVAVEKAVFAKTEHGWIAQGRFAEHPAQPLTGAGWQGLKAVVDCGVSDEQGFHAAAGECLWVVLSNGKRSVVIDTEGVAGNDALSARSIQSLRFTR